MDAIVISFEGLEPQEVRVTHQSNATVQQRWEWCVVGEPGRSPWVKFKAKLERWERVHEQD